MSTSSKYVVATVKPWNLAAFSRCVHRLPGVWELIETPEELTPERIRRIQPRYVFFPHWSWRVSADIHSHYECVCFHLSDVPYGRGGSPLQNLILRGHHTTMLTALRMIEEIDAGPVYLKQPLSLEGSAEQIFSRAADVVYDMIKDIVVRQPVPVAQSGDVVQFSRRTPDQSVLPRFGSPRSLYDFIRMLDAPTYPKAFADLGDYRIEFDQAELSSADVLTARATFKLKGS
jgi:methionyl-tRNA formyltransferase